MGERVDPIVLPSDEDVTGRVSITFTEDSDEVALLRREVERLRQENAALRASAALRPQGQ
jgi:HAMP domain-containing protein